MGKRSVFRLLALLTLLVLTTSLGRPVAAQSYSFAVPDLRMQVYVQPDASVKIVYEITFNNYGSPIDIVDIGVPHSNYSISNMSASINGVNLRDIRKSEYVNPGVEVHLGDQAIPRGSQGTLHFEFTMPDLIFQDTTNKDLASLQITPTWFDSDLVRGTSYIQIAIYMLEGVHPDEMLYQDVPFTEKVFYQGRAVAVWQWPQGTATQAYRVGVSFPQRGMTRVVKLTLIQLTNKWLEDNPTTRFILGAVAMIMFAVLFFRFSGGTGLSVFAILGGGILLLLFISPISALIAPVIAAPLVVLNESSLKKKRKTYLPAIAQVEGGGIKRGLTAPEAGVLVEMPLNKVLTLVLFGLLEKGVIEVKKEEPLTVAVTPDFQVLSNKSLNSAKEQRLHRRRIAQEKGTIIHAYEDAYLTVIEQHHGKAVRNIDFSKPTEMLIKATAAKMKGFDFSDSQEYYRRVIDRAMEQASALGEVEAREQYLDKYLPWVMMNDNYPTVLTHRGYNYWPVWVRGSRPAGTVSAAPKASGPAIGGRTRASDVAGSFAGWAESTMGGMAAAIMPGSLNIPGVKGGFVDLSGADRVTGDIFTALAKSSGGSGGGGGCACAGCACACACAGGGR
ncbi:MAG: hypothetical protein JXR84_14095 [Anaerolineae bacterium]|nr:hypothetical protein [Anaerolineae bacterium]